jgi:hypothetical protein
MKVSKGKSFMSKVLKAGKSFSNDYHLAAGEAPNRYLRQREL